MNRLDRRPLTGGVEASVLFGDAEFTVLRAGSFVRCAVTGEPIPLDDLKYWSVDRQEAYVDVAASVRREERTAASRGHGLGGAGSANSAGDDPSEPAEGAPKPGL